MEKEVKMLHDQGNIMKVALAQKRDDIIIYLLDTCPRYICQSDMEILVSADKCVEYAKKTENQHSLFWIAIHCNDADIPDILRDVILRGVDTSAFVHGVLVSNNTDKLRFLLRVHTVSPSHVAFAATLSSPDMLSAIYTNGIELSIKIDYAQNTVLHYAKDVATAQFILEYYPTLINARNLAGETPLMHAVRQNSLAYIGFLVNSGADVNARDNKGMSALNRILVSEAFHGSTDIITYLLAQTTIEPHDMQILADRAVQRHLDSSVFVAFVHHNIPVITTYNLIRAIVHDKTAIAILILDKGLRLSPYIIHGIIASNLAIDMQLAIVLLRSLESPLPQVNLKSLSPKMMAMASSYASISCHSADECAKHSLSHRVFDLILCGDYLSIKPDDTLSLSTKNLIAAVNNPWTPVTHVYLYGPDFKAFVRHVLTAEKASKYNLPPKLLFHIITFFDRRWFSRTILSFITNRLIENKIECYVTYF
jgi:hypothetical protein